MKRLLRRFVRWAHLWLGLIAGIFISLMGFTGGVVALRLQFTSLLSPARSDVASCGSPDLDRAVREVTAWAHSPIDRIYPPDASDTRYHFRLTTGNPSIYKHVIYDICEGHVLGTLNFGWMDWTVDLHHNLLSGKTGRRCTGFIGIAMLIAGLSGFVLWLLSNPRLSTAFRVNLSFSRRTPRELHRAFGLGATIFLVLESFTGIFLAFPQTLHSIVGSVAPISADVRPASARKSGKVKSEQAGLATLIAAARNAVPDGVIREIRMPEKGAAAQIRMWRPDDFRSSGNNVVYLSTAGKVLDVERYSDRPSGNRVIQAFTALHYDEWGGVTIRLICTIAGLSTPLLFVSGMLIWWYSRPKRKTQPVRQVAGDHELAMSSPAAR